MHIPFPQQEVRLLRGSPGNSTANTSGTPLFGPRPESVEGGRNQP
jgi:hypothetical protein